MLVLQSDASPDKGLKIKMPSYCVCMLQKFSIYIFCVNIVLFKVHIDMKTCEKVESYCLPNVIYSLTSHVVCIHEL